MRKTSLCLVLGLISAHAFSYELLPNKEEARESLISSPKIIGAESRRESLNYKAESIATGPEEFVLRGNSQKRHVSADAIPGQYREFSGAIERPFRMWGKAGVDENIASATRSYADHEYNDTLHEASKELLSNWFLYLKSLQTRIVAERNNQLGDQIARITHFRHQVGDVARLDSQLASAEQGRLKAMLEMAKANEQSSAAAFSQKYPKIKLIKQISWPGIPTIDAKREVLKQTYLERNHELKLAKSDSESSSLKAKRAELDKIPDPTVGVYTANEFGGSEKIYGLTVSFPIPSGSRSSNAKSASADATTAHYKVVDTERKISIEFDQLWSQMISRKSASDSLIEAANIQNKAALTAQKAYVLGEGTISDLIAARKAANENQLAADLMRLDALESYYRVKLDLHQIWDFD
jgi:outer membrane protein TolC